MNILKSHGIKAWLWPDIQKLESSKVMSLYGFFLYEDSGCGQADISLLGAAASRPKYSSIGYGRLVC